MGGRADGAAAARVRALLAGLLAARRRRDRPARPLPARPARLRPGHRAAQRARFHHLPAPPGGGLHRRLHRRAAPVLGRARRGAAAGRGRATRRRGHPRRAGGHGARRRGEGPATRPPVLVGHRAVVGPRGRPRRPAVGPRPGPRPRLFRAAHPGAAGLRPGRPGLLRRPDGPGHARRRGRAGRGGPRGRPGGRSRRPRHRTGPGAERGRLERRPRLVHGLAGPLRPAAPRPAAPRPAAGGR